MEYGVDLSIMGEMEKGIRMDRITETDYDANPPKEVEKKTKDYLARMRSRKMDRVPIGLQGKGNTAYLL